MNVAWDAFVDPRPAYLSWFSVNPCAAHENFLNQMRQDLLWRQYNRRNPLVNPWVFRQGQCMDGLVTQ